MTRLTTFLIYSGLFLGCLQFVQSRREPENERRVLEYIPDLAEYILSYNRLLNQGDLHKRRPYVVRRNLNQTNTISLPSWEKFLAPFLPMFSSLFEPPKMHPVNGTRRNKKLRKEDSEIPLILENLEQSTKQKPQPCHVLCPKTDSPICATSNKHIAEFPSECEFHKQLRCCKQFHEGWKLRNRGACPKTARKPFVERLPCPSTAN